MQSLCPCSLMIRKVSVSMNTWCVFAYIVKKQKKTNRISAGTNLQNVIELSLEFKVRFGFEDDLLQGFLEGLDSSFGFLAELCDALVLLLTAQALLLRLVHLTSTGNMTETRTLHDPTNHT